MRRITQILLLIALAALLIPLFLPKKIQATAEKEFNLPASVLFEQFNNLNNFSKWDPWTSSDPNTKQSFFSPYRGLNAGYRWENSNSSGEIIIESSIPHKMLQYTLDGMGLTGNSKMLIEFIPVGNSKTKVIWMLSSEDLSYFSRYYNYFTSQKFNEDLSSGLIALEESLNVPNQNTAQQKSLSPGEIKTEVFEGEKLIAITNETSLDEQEIETATRESFGLLHSYLVDFLKVAPEELGKPVSYFEFVDLAAKKAKFYCGYPIKGSVATQDGMELKSIPALETIVSVHKGSYNTLHNTINLMKEYAKANTLSTGISYWEEFQNDPEKIKNPSELRTKIYIPINN